jgi:O-antigen ligase
MVPGLAASAPPLRAPELRWNIVAQILFVIAPAMAAFALEQLTVAGMWLIAALAITAAWSAIQRNRLAVAAIVVAVLPALVMVRGFAIPYNAPLLVLSGALALVLTDGEMVRRFWSNALTKYLFMALTLYWLASFMVTMFYGTNLKCADLAVTVTLVYLLATRRSYLATMLLGLGITTIVVGAAFLPHGGRLGMVEIDDSTVGNPILLGVPCALTVLLTLAQGGRWLLLENRPWIRYPLSGLAMMFLFLSSSRGSWAVAIAAIGTLLVFDRSSRGPIGRASLLGVALFAVLLSTPLSETAIRQFDKLLDPGKSLVQKTSGRSEQWVGFPAAFMAAPIVGHGPGKGREASYQYARINLIWHSLYLQIGAELGIIGLAILFTILGKICATVFGYWQRFNESVPIAALAGYCTIGLSVSAIDPLSGVFLGIAVAAAHQENFYVARSASVVEVAYPESA